MLLLDDVGRGFLVRSISRVLFPLSRARREEFELIKSGEIHGTRTCVALRIWRSGLSAFRGTGALEGLARVKSMWRNNVQSNERKRSF